MLDYIYNNSLCNSDLASSVHEFFQNKFETAIF